MRAPFPLSVPLLITISCEASWHDFCINYVLRSKIFVLDSLQNERIELSLKFAFRKCHKVWILVCKSNQNKNKSIQMLWCKSNISNSQLSFLTKLFNMHSSHYRNVINHRNYNTQDGVEVYQAQLSSLDEILK